MKEAFPQYHWKPTPVLALIGAVLLACGLILIIPLTQLMGNFKPEITTYRKIITLQPPPPPTPPSRELEPPPQQEPPMPELNTPPQALTPKPLDLALNPGIDDAIAMGLQALTFNPEADVIAEIKAVFTFQDLPETPRVLNTPRITFPPELSRRGIKEGKVVLLIEINEQGKAKTLKIISSTHPKLEPVAQRIVKQALFSVPQVDGKAVKVQGKWPLYLQAPQ